MNKSEYLQYLASREWAILKQQVKKRSNGKCERCLVGNHDATHHLTYERTGRERLEDLQAVCEPCHNYLSGKSEFDPSEFERLKTQACVSIYSAKESIMKIVVMKGIEEHKNLWEEIIHILDRFECLEFDVYDEFGFDEYLQAR